VQPSKRVREVRILKRVSDVRMPERSGSDEWVRWGSSGFVSIRHVQYRFQRCRPLGLKVAQFPHTTILATRGAELETAIQMAIRGDPRLPAESRGVLPAVCWSTVERLRKSPSSRVLSACFWRLGRRLSWSGVIRVASSSSGSTTATRSCFWSGGANGARAVMGPFQVTIRRGRRPPPHSSTRSVVEFSASSRGGKG